METLVKACYGYQSIMSDKPCTKQSAKVLVTIQKQLPLSLTGSKKGNLRVQSVLLAPLSTISDETPSYQRTSRF